jgi:hypothetical protein
VQHFLGRSDPGFTLRRYVHLLDDDLPTPDPLRADKEREARGGDRRVDAPVALEA